MVYKMDTDSFIMASIRFSRLRCISPAHVYSDNGMDITAGEKELRARFDNLINDINLPTELAKKKNSMALFTTSSTTLRGYFGALGAIKKTGHEDNSE